MAKFGYTHLREMDPVVGRKFSTTYFKQSRKEQQRTQHHVDQLLDQFKQAANVDPAFNAEITAPQKKYARRETGGYYSILDIITDMSTQMKSGKDIPSGMLGRWNRLFADTGNEIVMVPEADLPPTNNYSTIFVGGK